MKAMVLLTLIACTSFVAPVWSAEPAKASDKGAMAKEPSKDDREKMAVAHEKMAACLRSDQDMKQCHEALHKECKSMMGGSCPMGMDHEGKGGHHH